MRYSHGLDTGSNINAIVYDTSNAMHGHRGFDLDIGYRFWEFVIQSSDITVAFMILDVDMKVHVGSHLVYGDDKLDLPICCSYLDPKISIKMDIY